MLIAVAINQRYPGHSRQAAHVAAQCGAGAYAGKYVVVVDDDIDVSTSMTSSGACCSAPTLRPRSTSSATPGRRRSTLRSRRAQAGARLHNSRAIIDACRPYHWRDQFPKVNMPSREAIKRVREKFGNC